MVFRADLHVHSRHSHDSSSDPTRIVKSARDAGLDAIAVTDHDTVEGSLETLEVDHSGLLVVPGVEVSSEMGHLLALGVMETPDRTLRFPELVERIHELGGIAVLAHPFDPFRSSVDAERVSELIDGVEVANGHAVFFGRHVKKATEFAERHGLGISAGSDSHKVKTVGDTYLEMDFSPGDVEDILDTVVSGSGRPGGGRTSLRTRFF